MLLIVFLVALVVFSCGAGDAIARRLIPWYREMLIERAEAEVAMKLRGLGVDPDTLKDLPPPIRLVYPHEVFRPGRPLVFDAAILPACIGDPS